MTEMVKLNLSDDMLQRARETAKRTGDSLEDVLLKWLERGSTSDIAPLVPGDEYHVFTLLGNEHLADELYQILKAAEESATE